MITRDQWRLIKFYGQWSTLIGSSNSDGNNKVTILTKRCFWSQKQKRMLAEVLEALVGMILLGDKRIKVCVGFKGLCWLKVINNHMSTIAIGIRRKPVWDWEGLCGPEGLKAHAGKMTFVVGTIVCVGVEGLCGPDKSTFLRVSGPIVLDQPETKYICIHFFIQFNSTKV